jgi:hypothetical protein
LEGVATASANHFIKGEKVDPEPAQGVIEVRIIYLYICMQYFNEGHIIN